MTRHRWVTSGRCYVEVCVACPQDFSGQCDLFCCKPCCMFNNNVFAIEDARPIEQLVSLVGDMGTCRLLGFVHEDEMGVLSLSKAGVSYLVFMAASDVSSIAEAFATGYDCGVNDLADQMLQHRGALKLGTSAK